MSTQQPTLPADAIHGKTPPANVGTGTRRLYRHQRWEEASIWRMEAPQAGSEIVGSAVIESDATILVVPKGFVTRLAKHRLFHLRETDQARRTH